MPPCCMPPHELSCPSCSFFMLAAGVTYTTSRPRLGIYTQSGSVSSGSPVTA